VIFPSHYIKCYLWNRGLKSSTEKYNLHGLPHDLASTVPLVAATCTVEGEGCEWSGKGSKRNVAVMNTKILWHIDPLLGNDREISNYTTAISE
jgi:hypothetical protein